MKKKIMLFIMVLVALVVAGSFIQIQTAYEHFPVEERTAIIAYRILWPWQERYSTSWVPARTSMQSARTTESTRMYGFLKTHDLVLDSLEISVSKPKTNGAANQAPQTIGSEASPQSGR